MKSDYYERKAARISRLHARAEAKERQADMAFQTAHEATARIPFGQPILVGHHSERRHRAAIARMEKGMERGVSLVRQAQALYQRAIAAESNQAISSDNPDALELLTGELSSREENQQFMKAVNKAYRKGDEALLAMGFTRADIAAMREEISKNRTWGNVPFANFRLTNNNNSIKRIQKRIAVLKRAAQDVNTEITFGGGKVIDSVDNNRIQIFFKEKPDPDLRTTLKRHGFKWAPSVGAWQPRNA